MDSEDPNTTSVNGDDVGAEANAIEVHESTEKLERDADPKASVQRVSNGSTWRRWDLHVHTPGTALNGQFGSWDEYLEAIETQNDVSVIGVTDYFSISNYSKLKRYKEEGRIPDIDLLIPNIEFRVAPPNDRAKGINIHLLISPVDPEHETKIQQALSRLSCQYGGGNYSCEREQLIALGRAYDPNANHDQVALSTGVNQFKVDFSTLRKWYRDELWLSSNSLIVVAAGDDGLSGFQQDGAWSVYRQEITRFSQMIFSGRPGERDFWVGRRRLEDIETIQRLGGFKPCIHGSDAHEIEKLFKPDKDRYCWIKADATFEGLKQLLYEPADRVHIGRTPPTQHDEARVIKSVTLSSTNDWFDEIELPLNSDLVSIIGRKGSGKSALAEMISYAAGSWPKEEEGTFLKRAGENLRDLRVKLTWGDGTTTESRIGDKQSDANGVRFLSQRFVERLCSDDHVGKELINEIEAVVFSYLDHTDTLNASSFGELRSIRTKGIREEGQRLRNEMLRSIREECELRENAQKLPSKKERLRKLGIERAGLIKQVPSPGKRRREKGTGEPPS